MAVRDSFPRRSSDPLSTVSRYDLVLAIIPVAFFLGMSATTFASVSFYDGLVVASILGGLATLDALLIHPPTDGN
jgi:hypothetical protein